MTDLLEIEKKLLTIWTEVAGQMDLLENESIDERKWISELDELISHHGEYGVAYDTMVDMFERVPIKLTGPTAVRLLEVGLTFGYKTDRDEDEQYRRNPRRPIQWPDYNPKEIPEIERKLMAIHAEMAGQAEVISGLRDYWVSGRDPVTDIGEFIDHHAEYEEGYTNMVAILEKAPFVLTGPNAVRLLEAGMIFRLKTSRPEDDQYDWTDR